MRKTFSLIFFLFIIFCQDASGQTLSRSGRWLYYNSSPIYLIGYDTQQLFADTSYTEAQVQAKIDYLATYGINAIRIWVNNWFLTKGAYATPYTYSRGKWDLSSFDTSFFTRYTNLITYARSKGIIVEVAVFSEAPCVGATACGTNLTHWTTYDFYYEGANNDQGVWSNVGGDLWPEFFTLNHTESGYNLTTYQLALATKVIDEFKPIGNVFFLVHNEFPWAGPGDTSTGSYVDQVYTWQQYMADYFHTTKGAITSAHAHEYSGMQIEGIEYWNTRDSVDVMAFHPNSDSTSNANINALGTLLSGQQNKNKILLIDEGLRMDSTATLYQGAVREMFASFVNGIYYFAYLHDPFTIGDATWLSRVGALQTLNNISALVNWSEMSRNPSLVTAGPGQYWEGIANSGVAYCFYFTGTPTTTSVNFSALPTGIYSYVWYATTSSWSSTGIASGTVSGGTNVKVTAPPKNLWDAPTGTVLVLKKTDTPVGALNYYVRPNGNDSCNGLYDEDGAAGNCAKATIQAAVNLATTPGSTVTIHAGRYAGVAPIFETVASGTAENYITIKAAPGETVTTYRIVVKHSYIRLEGLTVLAQNYGPDTAAIKLTGGNYIYITGCRIIGAGYDKSYGISNANTGVWNSNVTITNTIFDGQGNDPTKGFRIALYLGGNNNTISYSTFKEMNCVERACELVGGTFWFHHNEVKNFNKTVSGAHMDIFQLVDDVGSTVLIENNYFHDLVDTQIGHLSVGSQGVTPTGTYAYTFRNNIFANISNPININVPNTKFYNNTFYRCSYNVGNVLNIQKQGWTGLNFDNNAFVGCGRGDQNNNGYPLKSGESGTHNFISKLDGSPKTRLGTISATNINGGTPGFVSPSSNCYTNVCNFQITSSSSMLNRGKTISGFNTDYLGVIRPQGSAWDIGAYEYSSGTPGNITAP